MKGIIIQLTTIAAGPADVGARTIPSSGSVALTLHCGGGSPKTRSSSPVDVNVRVDMVELHIWNGALYVHVHGA